MAAFGSAEIAVIGYIDSNVLIDARQGAASISVAWVEVSQAVPLISSTANCVLEDGLQ